MISEKQVRWIYTEGVEEKTLPFIPLSLLRELRQQLKKNISDKALTCKHVIGEKLVTLRDVSEIIDDVMSVEGE